MQITVTFDSLEEFQKYIQTAQAPAGQPEAPKAEEKPKKAEKPAEKPQEPAEKPQEPAVEEAAPAVEAPAGKADPGIDMVAARKILADLNKEAGSNVARATLKKLGYASLKAVPEDRLQEVVDAARKEAGHA
jgi:outer membrane biosynthesis protein TonB